MLNLLTTQAGFDAVWNLLGTLSTLRASRQLLFHFLPCWADYPPLWDLLGCLFTVRASQQLGFQFLTSWQIMLPHGTCWAVYAPLVDLPGRLSSSLGLAGQFLVFASV